MVMKKFGLFLVLIFVLLVRVEPASTDDGFYVVSVGGVGTKITTVPYTISSPGFYYLGNNLDHTGTGFAIFINSNEVTLDLMGFRVIGPGPSCDKGIYVTGENVEVRNGSVRNFNRGIYSAGTSHRLANLKISNCGLGIYLNSSYGSIITNCQAYNNTNGITVNGSGVIIDKNTARGNSSIGIATFVPTIITNNVSTGNATGFYLGGASHQLVDRNSSYSNTTTNWSGLSGCTQGLNTP
jgi:parallel beta-helix repeat protein